MANSDGNSGKFHSMYDDSAIIQYCCGSQTNQNDLEKFNNSCDIFFDKYISDTYDQKTPFCSNVETNPVYQSACKYCSNASNFDECAIKHINDILRDFPDDLENVCKSINISSIGEGAMNSTIERGCFLCRYCNKCGAYNSDVCKGVVHSPIKNTANNISRSFRDKANNNDIDIILIVITIILASMFVCYIYKSRNV